MKVALLFGVVVVVNVLLLLVQRRLDESSKIPLLYAFEVSHAPQSGRAKDNAPENMSSMSATLDTSHLEISPLNDDAEWNMPRMVVTLDTSHLERSSSNEVAE